MTTQRSGGLRESPSRPFQLLTIASSAGGISALIHLLGDLPRELPVPVVVVQHLNPERETEIADVLGRHSALPVKLAEHEERAQPGTVYVAPPDQSLHVGADDTFSLTAPSHTLHPAADPVFETAADTYGSSTIACVLTGAGSDGAQGARAVKARGGTVIVQDPTSAEFSAMPGATIDAADVDFVLPLHEIAALVGRLVESGRT